MRWCRWGPGARAPDFWQLRPAPAALNLVVLPAMKGDRVMRRIARLLIVGILALVAGTASAALVSPLQEKPADQKKPQNPPQPENPQTPEAKPNQQPGVRLQNPGATPRPSAPSTPIA